MVIASIVILLRIAYAHADAPFHRNTTMSRPAHSRDQSEFQPSGDPGAGGGPEAAWLCGRAGDRLRDTGRRPLRDREPSRCRQRRDAAAPVGRRRQQRPPSSSPATAIRVCMCAGRQPTGPVFGIAECGVLTAMARAETFGVIAIAQRSIRRHIRYLRQMGLMDRLAGERPLNMSVAETASGRRNAREDDRGRPRAQGRRWRRRDRHGLRGHGPPPRSAGSRRSAFR